MSEMDRSIEASELPVIQLSSCPGKTYARPLTGNEGLLGIMADINYASDPANHDDIISQTLCDVDCRGPVKVPRKLLGLIPVGEKEVCPKGYKDQGLPAPGTITIS